MTSYSFTNGLFLKVHTNKARMVFKTASEYVVRDVRTDAQVGFIYDDLNANHDIKEAWEVEHGDITVNYVAARAKTLAMDDKLLFTQRMADSTYIPKSYLAFEDIPDSTREDQLFFVKQRGSSGSLGVDVHAYRDMVEINYSNKIIQQNSTNPMLLDGRRFKMRWNFVLWNKQMFLFKLAYYLKSGEAYDPTSCAREIHVINQDFEGTEFGNARDISNGDIIFDNVRKAHADMRGRFENEIAKIENMEYAIIGTDIVVNADYSIEVIELNHRPNFKHPAKVMKEIDTPLIRDTMRLIITGEVDQTDFIKI